MDRNDFLKREYMALKSEMVERIRIISSQASNAIATILTTWSMAIALTAICYSKETLWNCTNRFVLENIKNSIYLIPILFFLPLSIKSGENLRQIASISAYIKVFYEYPMVEKGDSAWETYNAMLSDIAVYKGKNSNLMVRYNGEYSILASISLIMFVFNAISTHVIFCGKNLPHEKYWIIWDGMYVATGIVMSVIIGKIHRASCARINYMDKGAWYLAGYIEEAKKNGLMGEYDYDKIYDVLKPYGGVKREYIVNKINSKWGCGLKGYRGKSNR